MTEDQIRRAVWTGTWMARGSAPTDTDYGYWVPMWDALNAHGPDIGVTDYAMKRLLGWQATGRDAPVFGDYATPPSPYHAVPPYPGDVVTPPVVVPPVVPPTSPAYAALSAQLDEIKGLLVTHMNRPAPTYEGAADIRYLGRSPITLVPKS